MSNLPHWIQVCWHLCAFTGLVVWGDVIFSFLQRYA
jgi:hypothetical protein